MGVSRPTPKGEVEGGCGPGPQPRGKLRGIWSRPTAKGEVEGDLVQEGCLVPGLPARGVPGSGGLGVPGPRGCLVRNGGCRPPGTATAAGGTHPTGMHSCF